MAYEPQPGTIPHRALAWLRAQTKVTGVAEYSTVQVCEGLDIDAAGFATNMGRAITAGTVKCRTREGKGKVLWWSLSDGEPLPVDPDAVDEPLIPENRVRQGDIRPGELLPGVRGDEPVEDAAALPFNACRYIDGSLIVVGVKVREDGAVILDPAQVRRVFDLYRDAFA